MTDLSKLAANGTALDLALAEARGEVTVKKLRTRGPRKGEGWNKANGAGRVVGAANGANGVTTGNRAAAGGGQMTITGQCGIGRDMVSNLDRVVSKAKRQYAEDRKAEARERAAEREAEAFAALDELLEG
jgi:hypothetical protein